MALLEHGKGEFPTAKRETRNLKSAIDQKSLEPRIFRTLKLWRVKDGICARDDLTFSSAFRHFKNWVDGRAGYHLSRTIALDPVIVA